MQNMTLYNIFAFLLLAYGTFGQSLTGSCSRPSPLCCQGLNNLCNRGNCYCDVACLRLRDCCPDFNSCVTNRTFTVTESPMINNITALSIFSGNCSAEPALCCKGSNMSCFRGGCFCDQSCLSYGDCCSDYTNTCQATTPPPVSSPTGPSTLFTPQDNATPRSSTVHAPSSKPPTTNDFHSVVSRVRVRFRASPDIPQQELESTFYSVSELLELFLKSRYSDILSFKIRKIIH